MTGFQTRCSLAIIPDYENDPTDYVVTNKSLGSGSSGGSDIGGEGEAVFAMVTNPDGNLVTRIGLGTAARETKQYMLVFIL